MSIKRIKVTNFKSFRNFEVDLNDFNVVIGANASGKSNFVNIFNFIRDISNSGLDNAVSMQGGSEYFRNIHLGFSEPFSIELILEERVNVVLSLSEGPDLKMITTDELVYRFSIEFMKRGKNFKAVEDNLTLKGELREFKGDGSRVSKRLGRAEVTIENTAGGFNISSSLPEGVNLQSEDIFPIPRLLAPQKSASAKSLILKGVNSGFTSPPLDQILGSISIFDFDPKLPKKAVPISGKNELESDGSNVAIVLKNILDDTKEKKSFTNIIKDVLPFVEDITVERFADKSLLFNIKEVYAHKRYLPASLMSDGTVNITLLVIALYFEKNPIVIVEEPERNVHPSLISKVASLLKDASRKKQVIVTTHNPDIIKHIDLKNLLLITREIDGFSTVCRPADKEHVKAFLAHDIGVEDLFIQNLLGV